MPKKLVVAQSTNNSTGDVATHCFTCESVPNWLADTQPVEGLTFSDPQSLDVPDDFDYNSLGDSKPFDDMNEFAELFGLDPDTVAAILADSDDVDAINDSADDSIANDNENEMQNQIPPQLQG